MNNDWYNLWMNQSNTFFKTANEDLGDLFSQHTFVNPQEHLKQISQWLDKLKEQWEFSQLTDEQKTYHLFWKNMYKIYHEAADLLLNQWLQRDKPIQSINELHQLWLTCCRETYQRMFHEQASASKNPYEEWMHMTFKFWESMPR